MHGWGIAPHIRRLSRKVHQGALYPALRRFEQQGWIQAKWGESENNRRAGTISLTCDWD
jgi:PadR family transcriptional regulator